MTATTYSENSLWSRFTAYLAFHRHAGQMPELDGLRGIAILLVLCRHAVRPFWSPDANVIDVFGWDFGVFMINGWVGVDLFFVLSGFLITHHIIRMRERLGDGHLWRPYLAKRVLRIVPAYYAVLFITLLQVFPYYEVPTEHLLFQVTYHMLFLQDYLPPSIAVTFWSLGVEEKFYLVAPLLILYGAKSGKKSAPVIATCALYALGIAARVYAALTNPAVDSYGLFFYTFRSPFHMTLDPILTGVLIALAYQNRASLPRLTSQGTATLLFWIGVGAILLMTTTSSMMDTITLWDKTLQPTAIALAFGCMTFGLVFGGGPARLFRSTTLFFFGRISYCLYLVHIQLVPVSLVLSAQYAPAERQLAVFLVVFLALSLAATLVLHYAVEKPFLRLKARVA